MWHTSIPQHNSNQGSPQQKHHLNRSKEKYGITKSYTSTSGDVLKIQRPTTETNITTELVVQNHFK